jgi:hypothetical protein
MPPVPECPALPSRPHPRPLSRLLIGVLVAALATAAVAPSSASAQATPEPTRQVRADFKGLIGGGILGAEIGFIVPAILVHAGVRELDEVWSWILFPTLGAVGGAIAGYFALEDPANGTTMSGEVQRGFPEAAVAVFATSIALIVPTFVGVLALTSYDPARDARGAGDDRGDDGGGPTEEARITSPWAGGPGLLRFDRGRPLLGIPMVGSRSRYTEEEASSLRLAPAQDLHVPLVSGAF